MTEPSSHRSFIAAFFISPTEPRLAGRLADSSPNHPVWLIFLCYVIPGGMVRSRQIADMDYGIYSPWSSALP